MEMTTIPAGTRIKSVRSGKYERLDESLVVTANYRAEDDTWVFVRGNDLYEVKLHPGD